jgi:OOP family OmpA-OmpF porin
MLFDFASDAIRPAYIQKLDQLGRFLQDNPQAFVVAQGHTDSIGGKEFNLALSAERALVVGEYLVHEFGIDPIRIIALWYGDANPAADNGTAEGRQLNRRVEIAIGGLN